MRGRDWITVPDDAVDALCRDGWRVERPLPVLHRGRGNRVIGPRTILSRVREPAPVDEENSACTFPNIGDGSGTCIATDLHGS